MDLAASGAVLGLDPMILFRADPLERELLATILFRAVSMAKVRDRVLANMIIEELGLAMARSS